jgi:small subunit ribosomal protein S4e
MARKSGSLRTKRSAAPSFWKIPRKEKRFVPQTEPGPHPKAFSYPVLVLLRDVLGLVRTRKEGLLVLNDGKITVDGRPVKSAGFPVGLMDILEISSAGKLYRIVPDRSGLTPVEASSSERSLKICQVRSKRAISTDKFVYGLHDGRSIILEKNGGTSLKPGDSCIIEVPGQKLQSSFRLAPSELALILKGDRSGEIVTVEGLKEGTFSRAPIASVTLSDGSSSEIPTSILLPLGKELPPLTISKVAKRSVLA